MEIKRGISQMAEYPNREINYVVPEDGQMYYVLEDGELSNGSIIATLDPKRAIDSGISCDTIGVFKEDGSVLIDFDKKEIKKISDDLLLVVNSKPTTDLVINALKNENDDISKTMMKDSSTSIVDRMMIEMGITGEILFSDAYSEANVYRIDSYNNKIGPDSSFIGKNDKSIYFHTNDASKATTIINLDGSQEENVELPVNSELPSDISTEMPLEENNKEEVNLVNNVEPETPSFEEFNPASVSMDFDEEMDNQDLKLDISQNILDGFRPAIEEALNSIELPSNDVEEEQKEEEKTIDVEIPTEEENSSDDIFSSNDVNIDIASNTDIEKESDDTLDNVISVMKKMIEETKELAEKISRLETELEEKNNIIEEKDNIIEEKDSIIASKEEIISKQESKKNELSSLLSEANEVLDNIEE